MSTRRLVRTALLLALASLIALPSVAPAHPGVLNVGRARPATATSFHGGDLPGRLVDGHVGTMWQTNVNQPQPMGSPVWWSVNLGEPAHVSVLTLGFAQWLGRYYGVPKTIVVEALVTADHCDGSAPTWTRILTVTSDQMPLAGAPYALDNPEREFKLSETVTATAVRVRFPDGNQIVGSELKQANHVALGEVEVTGEWAEPCPEASAE